MVICCIGTPKIIGDSLAPKIGDQLLKQNVKAFVYGTSKKPITALNYLEYYNHIITNHKNDFVIAVDCALGKKSDIGTIKITKKGITPGKAIGRTLNTIGDIGILGQVGNIDNTAYDELKNVSSSLINNLANKITTIIVNIINIYSKQNNLL